MHKVELKAVFIWLAIDIAGFSAEADTGHVFRLIAEQKH